MTKDKLIKELTKLKYEEDIEVAHIEADSLLLQYIHDKDITVAFEEIKKWYS